MSNLKINKNQDTDNNHDGTVKSTKNDDIYKKKLLSPPKQINT